MRFHKDIPLETQARTIPTFLTLYCFGFLYQLVLDWDALRLKNTIQVIGLCLYNVGLLIYGVVQYEQMKEAVVRLPGPQELQFPVWTETQPFLIPIPCILALTTVAVSFIAWKLYTEFAWTIYKHISADLRMKRRYLTYQVYIALLKFDFFFFLGFTIQFIVIVQDKTNVEEAITSAAIPVTIIILLLAAFWTRRENTIGMVISIVSFLRPAATSLALLTVLLPIDPLLWWSRILLLQARTHVRTSFQRCLRRGPDRTYRFRNYHNHPDLLHHNHGLYVHGQLQ